MFRQLILPFATIVLLTLALYWLIASRLLLDPPPADSSIASAERLTETLQPGPAPVARDEQDPAAHPNQIDSDDIHRSSTRTIEIFGRVMDANSQPIDDVFVTEERYFFNTRSNVQGNYKLLMDLPTHRYPTLNFLRRGFRSKRISLTRAVLQQNSSYELDLELEENPLSVRLSGWVGNEIGVALEGARVELTALQPPGGEIFTLTVFTDPRGNFFLEGVRADEPYSLSINLAPEYSIYRDPDFSVGLNPEQVNIVLESLRFVDIDGMILNRDSSPVADFEIYVSNVTTGVHSRKIVSDSSGFFSLRHFPLGEVSLATRGSDIYEINGLVLTDSEYRNLELIIDKGERFLTGWIKDENGLVPQRALVTLDQTFFEGPVRYHQYRSRATGTGGKFSFRNLGKGEYRITVYAPGYQKREVMHRLVNQSDEVEVTLQQLEN
ncbi:MAG: carboxypeptidase-like regulatory domain-containing protein [Gammaproteobacteria bacterium]|nr:carboxypeptidase-like regulatory domain-containing protein [Gammaproteobacteria bacterium]MDH3859459.1 carboxypeptidase-like regulatory domain-containing protein [Gammaproteobacteria bacterium]